MYHYGLSLFCGGFKFLKFLWGNLMNIDSSDQQHFVPYSISSIWWLCRSRIFQYTDGNICAELELFFMHVYLKTVGIFTDIRVHYYLFKFYQKTFLRHLQFIFILSIKSFVQLKLSLDMSQTLEITSASNRFRIWKLCSRTFPLQ